MKKGQNKLTSAAVTNCVAWKVRVCRTERIRGKPGWYTESKRSTAFTRIRLFLLSKYCMQDSAIAAHINKRLKANLKRHLLTLARTMRQSLAVQKQVSHGRSELLHLWTEVVFCLFLISWCLMGSRGSVFLSQTDQHRVAVCG